MDNSKTKRAAEDSSDESSSSAGSTGFSYKNFRPRKKPAPRRQDAGRRYQRGLLYDSKTGITCHFCRQKAVQKHVYCCKCEITYCTNCLRNRHGEDIMIETANDNDSWVCPKCRGGCGPGCKNCCNCTFCRKKQGLRPPKVSMGEMRAHGFDNVHDYLIHLETGESPESISARKAGKGWCRSYEQKHSKASENSQVHKRKEKETSKGADEVASSATNICQKALFSATNTCQKASFSATNTCQKVNSTEIERPTRNVEDKVKESKAQCPPPSVPKAPIPSETSKGADEVASSANICQKALFSATNTCQKASFSATNAYPKVNNTDIERPMRHVEDPPPVPKAPIPSQFSSKNSFKEKLDAKLAEAFDAQELKDLWETVKCRKPLLKFSETPQGMSSFTTEELGHSYIQHYPDLARELTATGEQEVKLKLLRGFFFWLEHASMLGSFKPWIQNDKDAECLELDGPDCEVLGVVLNVDGDKQTSNSMCHGKDQEDTQPQIKKDFVGNLSSAGKPIFNWDAEDIKPKHTEELLKMASSNPQIHVKEELDDS